MEYIKNHKIKISILGALALIIIAFIIFFTIMAGKTEVVIDAITFQEKYADTENKINNVITTADVRQGYKTDLLTYTDKVKQDYNMTIDDKDAFLTFARKIDSEFMKSKMHVLSFYGKVKKQYEQDVANNYFTPEVKNKLETLFAEYNTAFKEEKFQEAYDKLDEISKNLSVRVTEEGVTTEATTQAAPAQQEAQPQQEATAAVAPTGANGKGYHPEATAGQQVVDPNNGNIGVVAQNGIEVYTLPNESTYSYITKEEFVAMLVRNGTREALARIWADQMANSAGLITIGVDDDGTYE